MKTEQQSLFDFNYQPSNNISNYKISLIDCETAKQYIIKNHYSHGCHNAPSPCYGLFDNDKLIGCLMFATPCSENVRASIFGEEYKDWVIELHRLHILDVTPKNTESWFISRCIKLLKQDNPKIKAIISFADSTQGHCGIIYQATNWIYLGCNNGNSIYVDESGVSKHTHLITVYRQRHPELKNLSREEILNRLGLKRATSGRKHRYLFLRGNKKEKASMFAIVKDKILPYPKIDKKDGLSEEDIFNQEEINFTQMKLF